MFPGTLDEVDDLEHSIGCSHRLATGDRGAPYNITSPPRKHTMSLPPAQKEVSEHPGKLSVTAPNDPEATQADVDRKVTSL